MACRAWQLLTQGEGLPETLVFAQMTMQAFSSSLQRSGAAVACTPVSKGATKAIAARSRIRVMPLTISPQRRCAPDLLAPVLADERQHAFERIADLGQIRRM